MLIYFAYELIYLKQSDQGIQTEYFFICQQTYLADFTLSSTDVYYFTPHKFERKVLTENMEGYRNQTQGLAAMSRQGIGELNYGIPSN